MLAFLQNDAAGMKQQVAWATGKPGMEDGLLDVEANTAAYSGRLRKAREFSRRAMDSAERAEEKETVAAPPSPRLRRRLSPAANHPWRQGFQERNVPSFSGAA
jgi:hypothetical protein